MTKTAGMALVLTGLFLVSACGWLPKVTIIDDPLDKAEHLNLGLAYEKSGELDLAEREYRLAEPLPGAYLALGNLAFQKGDASKAEELYRKTLSLEPLPEAANNLAWLYLVERRELRTARQLARQAVEEGQKRGLDERRIWSFKGTLAQIETALNAQEAVP